MRSLAILLLLSAVAIVAAGGDGKCPSSHYAGADGVCTACPENSYAPKGSDSIDDCCCWDGYEKQTDGSCTQIEKVDGGWCPLSECSASCGCGVQTRVCECPAPSGGGAACKGKATVACVSDACVGTEICPASTYSADGSYIPGQSNCTACPEFSWSPAGSTSINDCSCWSGYEGANGGPCTPVVPNVNGGWCPASDCSATCGGGVQTRTCGCPAPQGNGAQCKGASQVTCNECACEVPGEPCPTSTYSADGTYQPNVTECTACPEFSWSPSGSDNINDCVCWSGYQGANGGPCTEIIPSVNGGWCPVTECNATCDGGVQTRVCSCPPRQGDGADCEGSATLACNTDACVKQCREGYYSSTGTYDCRTQTRCRKCPKYSWSPAGSDSKKDCVCWDGYELVDGRCKPVTEVNVNGGWCPASDCSVTCGGGTQTRVCECPAPQGNGANCTGSATYECNKCACDDAPPSSKPCPTSTYSADGTYTPGQTECTACPESTWSPSGSTNVTDCGCWAGYEGPAGGPCTEVEVNVNGGWCPYTDCDANCNGGTQTRTCACPAPQGNGAQCDGVSESACNTQACENPQPGNVTCSDAADEDQCNNWEGCEAVSGYDCSTGDWCTYLGCVASDSSAAQVQTCAVNAESGNRAWFADAQLPAGYVATTPMGNVRSCCAPQNCNSSVPVKGGCKWELGGACVVLQFRGECPVDVSDAVEWVKNLWKDLASQVDVNQYAGLAQALISNWINVIKGPILNNGTNTFNAVLQISPATAGIPYTPEQVVAWIQDLVNSGNLAATNVASQLQGVAAYSSFTADSNPGVVITVDNAANSFAQSSLMLVLATGVVGTIVAKLASFMQ